MLHSINSLLNRSYQLKHGVLGVYCTLERVDCAYLVKDSQLVRVEFGGSQSIEGFNQALEFIFDNVKKIDRKPLIQVGLSGEYSSTCTFTLKNLPRAKAEREKFIRWRFSQMYLNRGQELSDDARVTEVFGAERQDKYLAVQESSRSLRDLITSINKHPLSHRIDFVGPIGQCVLPTVRAVFPSWHSGVVVLAHEAGWHLLYISNDSLLYYRERTWTQNPSDWSYLREDSERLSRYFSTDNVPKQPPVYLISGKPPTPENEVGDQYRIRMVDLGYDDCDPGLLLAYMAGRYCLVS